MYFKLFRRLLATVLVLLPLSLQAQPEYIGAESCQACHAQETEDWQGSNHQLAMQLADESSVLGDFDRAVFEKDGVTTTFFRDQGRFMVNTDGADGKLKDFEVAYVFGVYPLQQYMVRFPKGKVQVLGIAWDTRTSEEGGQRWYSLYPDTIVPAGDVLHWTGPNLNWNYMCADCHSTDLQKNYDSKTDAYQTTFKDINVSCEACHGPGSLHQDWAESVASGTESKLENKGLTVRLNERAGVTWETDPDTGKPLRSEPNTQRTEIQVCARCHSRRAQISDDFTPGQPFMDAYRPSLLNEGLYHADGQMQDEVYVWGSFRQSKMYQAGVTCSDCHNPHKAEVKAPGAQVCAQCHAPAKYASKEHTFHAPDSEASNCIACHMPVKTLMGVDQRNDHSFRVPRPDLGAALGSPTVCAQCHLGQTADWAADRLKAWYGKTPTGYQRFAPALAAARLNDSSAAQRLQVLALNSQQSGIARATAFSEMATRLDQNSLMALQQGLNDDDPVVRLGALTGLENAPMQYRIMALPAVWDDIKSVRIAAARMLAAYPEDQLREDRREKLNSVLDEYIDSQLFNAERPEAQINLGTLYVDQQKPELAEQAYRKALALQPQFVPAYVNLGQLLSGMRRDDEAEALYREGMTRLPETASAPLYHSLGLLQVRQKKLSEALVSLAKAATLERYNQRYQYVYAVALQSTGDLEQALGVLKSVLVYSPDAVDILFALTTFNRDAGRREAALEYALKLQALMPENPQIKELLATLQP